MKALVLLPLLLAQVNPQSSEELLRSNVSVLDTPGLREAVGPVEQWLGRRLVVYEGSVPSLPMVDMFPSAAEPAEAILTPTAVFVAKQRFTQFRSSFELAEFLTHAAAHVRLDHAQKWSGNARGRTVDLERVRKEYEEDADKLAEEILPTADCAPGPCARFGRLLAAVRK